MLDKIYFIFKIPGVQIHIGDGVDIGDANCGADAQLHNGCRRNVTKN